MIQYRDLTRTLHSLIDPPHPPVIAHISPHISKNVQGGEKTVLGALRECFSCILMPAFTYQTMVYPKKGPKDNGIEYNNPPRDNQEAVFFHPNLRVSPSLGDASEQFRTLPSTTRSTHPILSFCALNMDQALQSQTLSRPYAPLTALLERRGWVMLVDVDQTKNFSIHYALKEGGRNLFTRWALTSAGVKVCPHFPGCEDGFTKLNPRLENVIRKTNIDGVQLMSIPLKGIMREVKMALARDPLALLCDKAHCLQCESIRARTQHKTRSK